MGSHCTKQSHMFNVCLASSPPFLFQTWTDERGMVHDTVTMCTTSHSYYAQYLRLQPGLWKWAWLTILLRILQKSHKVTAHFCLSRYTNPARPPIFHTASDKNLGVGKAGYGYGYPYLASPTHFCTKKPQPLAKSLTSTDNKAVLPTQTTHPPDLVCF